MPPSASTATSVVPPPMSTTMLPCASATGRPAPIAAAIGSSIRDTCRAPAASVASSTALRSTSVVPLATQSTTRANETPPPETLRTNYRSKSDGTSQSPSTAPTRRRSGERLERSVELFEPLRRLVVGRREGDDAGPGTLVEPEVRVVESQQAGGGMQRALGVALHADDVVTFPDGGELRR